jgi:hypothetical protein
MRAPLRRLGPAGLFAAALLGVIVGAAPAAAQRDDPLPRFEGPLCPGIVGLKVEAAEMMVARIRDHAQDLGVRLADTESCEPNLIVAFINDGQDYLQRLSTERGDMFESLGVQERRELLADEGPVRVLAQVRTRSRDGMVVPRRVDLVNPPQTEMWMAHSRIYTPTRQDIVSALVLVDRGAISGMTLDQLADHAVMRAFVTERSDLRGVEGGSILDLFGAPEGERPAGLTASDLALLSTLYEGPANLRASARIAGLQHAAREGEREAE